MPKPFLSERGPKLTRAVTDDFASSASGFFFARGERLFPVTSRHVMIDEPSQHFPDRLERGVHTIPLSIETDRGMDEPDRTSVPRA